MASKRKTGRKRRPNHKNKRRDVLRVLYYLASIILSVVRLAFYIWDWLHR